MLDLSQCEPYLGLSLWLGGKEPACSAGDIEDSGSIQSLGWEDPLEERMATHSSILACRLPVDRGARWAAVHVVAKSRTRLSD